MVLDPQTSVAGPLPLGELETQLNSFDRATRASALAQLLVLAQAGQLTLAPEQRIVNMHCHTFFSFNAYGHSPTSLVWLAKQSGYEAIGIVDFDVLDAVDEFLDACNVAGVRGSAGIETRVFVPEYATREINSSGEPGVSYHMGIGFTSAKAPEAVATTLTDMQRRARERNVRVMERVNGYLDPVKIDYDRDVLPLTPSGNATERHMLLAYMRAAEQTVDDPARFWAAKLNTDLDQVRAMMRDVAKLQNLMRAKLMKRGGVGYVQPGRDSFPTIEEFHSFIVACGALPCITWLDGTSAAEQDIRALLEFWLARGGLALNIVPDRNWNIADPEQRRLKVQKLYEVVELAAEYDLPLNVGTEMNSPGNKLVDDFDAPELAPVRKAFLDGARFIYGHTVMQRVAGRGYLSPWAVEKYPGRRERNAFYTEVGYRLAPGQTKTDWDAD